MFADCTSLKTVTFPSNATPEFKAINSSTFKNTALTSIVIPDYIESIGLNAFENCTHLNSISFGADSKLTTISGSAFKNTGLSSASLPKKLTSIGPSAFIDCRSLSEVTFADDSALKTIGISAFSNTALKTITIPGSVTSINDNSFLDCVYLKTVTFGNSPVLTRIGNNAFKGSAIERITIPSSIETIGYSAFENCRSLNNVTLNTTSADFKTIEKNVFRNSSITSIAIPATVTTIGEYAFDNCIGLKTVTFNTNSKLETIGSSAFRWTAIKDIQIPGSVTGIMDGAFEFCCPNETTADVFEVTFGQNSNLKTIGSSAFRSSYLSGINVPDNVETIGEDAFSGCSELSQVTFGVNSKLKKISDYAFEGCSELTKFEIPKSVTEIGKNPFIFKSGTFTLTVAEDSSSFVVDGDVLYDIGKTTVYAGFASSVTIDDNVTTINDSAFAGLVNLKYVYLPKKVDSISGNPFHSCANDITIEVEEGSQFFSDGSVLYSSDMTKLIAVCTDEPYVFPVTLEEIGNGAFRGREIHNVTIPTSITKIGSDAFRNTHMISIRIPDGVETIGNYAFADCEELVDIALPHGSYAKISDGMFRNSGLKSIIIPGNVNEIGIKAFQECYSLKWVTFEDFDVLTTVAKDAFDRCTLDRVTFSNIKNLNVSGNSINDWNFCGATYIRCMILNTGTEMDVKDISILPERYLQIGGDGANNIEYTFSYYDDEGQAITVTETLKFKPKEFYIMDGEMWKILENVAELPEQVKPSFTYNGNVQTSVPDGVGFTAVNGSGISAGSYTAKATRTAAYPIWVDGLFDPLEYSWYIGKATYDMSAAKWSGGPFTYDGTAKRVVLSGLPAGVSVKTYSDSEKTSAGDYIADSDLAWSNINYEKPYAPVHYWSIAKHAVPVTPDTSLFAITDVTFNVFPTVTGSILNDPSYDGSNVKVKYYSDEECTKEVENIILASPGKYYAKATVDGLNNYSGVLSSAPVEFYVPSDDEPVSQNYLLWFILPLAAILLIVAAYMVYRRRTRETGGA